QTKGEAIDTNKKTIASLRDLIKAERESMESIDLEIDGNDKVVAAKQKLIEKYQAEIDAILGTNRARTRVIEAVKGSLAYLEKEVSLLEEKQSKLAVGSKEYFQQERAVRKAKNAVKDF